MYYFFGTQCIRIIRMDRSRSAVLRLAAVCTVYMLLQRN